jgi:NADH-quinone oxidoreductase chain I
MVTLLNLVRKPVTVQYPEQRAQQHPRFRGQEFAWYEERCTGCASCAKYCPLGIIKIVTKPGAQQTQEGEKYDVDTFSIEIARCMFCGLCVEACPYDALHMGSTFEWARERRPELAIHVDELKRAPKRPSTWLRPQLEEKGYNPFRDKPLGWQEVGRQSSNDPTPEQMRERWVEER